MANSEKYHINLVGSGSPSTKSKKAGTGMGRAKSQKGAKVRSKTQPTRPGKPGKPGKP